MASTAQRNLAAEIRAYEEGHRAYVDGREDRYRVISDTRHGKIYRVTVAALEPDEPIVFHCAPDGTGCYHDDHLQVRSREPGHVPCKHAALVARSMERKGQVRFVEGLWQATERYPFLRFDKPADPFAGLG